MIQNPLFSFLKNIILISLSLNSSEMQIFYILKKSFSFLKNIISISLLILLRNVLYIKKRILFFLEELLIISISLSLNSSQKCKCFIY